MPSLGDIWVRFRGDVTDLHKSLTQAKTGLAGFGDRIGAVGKQLNDTGRTMMVKSAVAGVAIGGLMKKGVDFERSLGQVGALLSNLPAEEAAANLRTFRKEVFSLSERGVGAKEAMGALYDLISARGEYATDAAGAMKALADATIAAKAGNTDLKTTINGLVTVQNSWGDSAGNVSQIMDDFFTTVRTGKTIFSEYIGSLSQVAGIAPQVGVAFKEIGGAVSILTGRGLSATESTTALRQMFVNLLKPTQQSISMYKMLESQLAKTGVQFKFTAETLSKVGLQKFLAMQSKAMELASPEMKNLGENTRQLVQRMDELKTRIAEMKNQGMDTSELQLQAKLAQKELRGMMRQMTQMRVGDVTEQMAQVFSSVQALGGALILGQDQAADFGKRMEQFTGNLGEVNRAFNLATGNGENMAYQWDQVKANLENANTALGTSLAFALSSVADLISRVSSAIIEWIERNPELAKQIGNWIALLVGVRFALGLVLFFGGKLLLLVKALVIGISFLASPIGLVVVAIAVLAAAITGIVLLISANWESIKSVTETVWGGIKKFLQYMVFGIVAIIRLGFGLVKAIIEGIYNVLYAITVGVWTSVFQFVSGAVTKIRDFVVGAWTKIKDTLFGVWQAIKNGVVRVWTGVVDWLKGAVDTIVGFFTGLPSRAYRWGYDMMSKFWDGLKKLFVKVYNWVRDAVGSVLDFFNPWAEHSPSLVEQVRTGYEAIYQSLQKYAGKMASAVNMRTPGGALATGVSPLPAGAHPSFAGVSAGGEMGTLTDNSRVEIVVNNNVDVQELLRQIGRSLGTEISAGGI